MARANSSLPVPLSPLMSTLASLAATSGSISKSLCMGSLAPTISSKEERPSGSAGCSRPSRGLKLSTAPTTLPVRSRTTLVLTNTPRRPPRLSSMRTSWSMRVTPVSRVVRRGQPAPHRSERKMSQQWRPSTSSRR